MRFLRFHGAFALLLGFGPAAAAQSCRASDSISVAMIIGLKSLVSSSVPAVITERQRMHVPVVAASEIRLVADDSVCSRLATAFGNAIGVRSDGVTPSGRVYVVQVGAVYVVRDPAISEGEYAVQMVMDNLGAILSRFTG